MFGMNLGGIILSTFYDLIILCVVMLCTRHALMHSSYNLYNLYYLNSNLYYLTNILLYNLPLYYII